MKRKLLSHKKWTLSFTSLILFLCLLFPSLANLIIDPYAIFHTGIFKQQPSINQHFNKIAHLKENPSKFTSFMLGNSRIGTTHPAVLEQYLPNSRFYNLTLSTANMEDMIAHLNYLIKNNDDIQTVYLQLDYQDMLYWGHDEKNYEYKKHPGVIGQSYLHFYFDYLTIFPFQTFKNKLDANLFSHSSPEVIYDINNTGMWIAKHQEEEIQRDPQGYIRNQPSFHDTKVDVWQKDTAAYAKMLNALQEIVTLSNRNHIHLILYTTPYNHAMLNYFNINDIITYLEDISKIHDYYFFSDYNTVTLNNINYYESGHFRGHVGQWIAAKIFNDTKQKIPNDFGIHLTKSNFSTYKKSITENLIHHRKPLLHP